MSAIPKRRNLLTSMDQIQLKLCVLDFCIQSVFQFVYAKYLIFYLKYRLGANLLIRVLS